MTNTKRDELHAALVAATGAPADTHTLDLWDLFLTKQGYLDGSLMDRIKHYAEEIGSTASRVITGKDPLVDVDPATIPSAPAILSVARAGSGAVAITFTPAEANGAAITQYTATSTPGGITASSLANPLIISGLNNGTSYTFTLTATNSVGTGPASSASSAITPATVPGAPTIGTATKGNGQVSVAFTAPASTGGSAITSYTATATPGGLTGTAASSPVVVSGLTNGTSYVFTVTATNAVGTGLPSATSAAAIPSTVPSAPTIGVATLSADTTASIAFVAPNNGGSAITGYTVTSTPESLTGTGSSSPISVMGLTPGITYTFTVTATNANGTSAASAASNSVTAVITGGNGPFDTLYAGTWVPVEGTTIYTPPVMSQPAKSTGINSPSYTDSNYGTKIFRVAQISDSPNNGTTKMRHEYSRRCPFNCDNTRYILQNSSGFFFLYNADTFQRIDGGVTTNDVKLGAIGTNSIYPKDPRDWTWHPTDPNKIIFKSIADDLNFYEFDVVTKVLTTKFSFAGRLAALGMGTGTNVTTGGEGRPSDDGRYWGFMVKNSSGANLGYISYDMETDTITGSMLSSVGVNNVTTSSLGNYICVSQSQSALSYEECAALPASQIVGSRAYSRDFSTFKQVSYTAGHSDVAIDSQGREVWVSMSPEGSLWTAIADSDLFMIPLAGAEGPTKLLNVVQATSQWHSHYSGCCAPDRPGWFIFSAYDSQDRGARKYGDDNIMLVELKNAGKIYRLADHRTTRYTYWQEPHATVSRDGLRVMYSCSWDSTSSSNAALAYMIGLPSWIYGGAVPPLLSFTFDTSTGWSLGASCTVTGGKLHCNNTAANVTNSYNTAVLNPGTYDITYTLSDFNAGNFSVRINSGGTLVAGATRSAGSTPNGTYTDRVTISAVSTAFEVRVTRQGATMDVKVDDITVVPA